MATYTYTVILDCDLINLICLHNDNPLLINKITLDSVLFIKVGDNINDGSHVRVGIIIFLVFFIPLLLQLFAFQPLSAYSFKFYNFILYVS